MSRYSWRNYLLWVTGFTAPSGARGRRYRWTQHFSGALRDISLVEGPTIVEETPFYTRVAVKSKSRWSNFTREVILYNRMQRIDFQVSTDWHDTDTFLKVMFQVTIDDPQVTSGIAHGCMVVEEPELEFCCHDWVHVGNSGEGIVFLNDGAYGANFSNGEIR